MSASATAPGQLPQHHGSKRSSSRLGTDQQQKAPPTLLQQHLQQRQAAQTPQEHLRCSSQLSAATDFSPLVSKQPKVGRGSTARMQRHVLQVADQLKGLAISWQQRLDNCELPPCTSPTKPAMITISAAVAAASGGRGTKQALLQAPDAAAEGRPAWHSEDWGSNSFQSSATAMCAYDASASCDLSSSTSSFVRYRSNQAAYGESPADIEEGDEEGDEECSEQQREDESDGYVCCETDEEAEAAQLRWHVQQLEQQQQQQAQHRALPSHSHLQQHAQQQVLAKHAQWQQQQQQVNIGAWARPAHDTVAPGCAITRGAASRAAPPATDNSSTAMQQGASGAASGGSVARSPMAAGASGGNIGKNLPPAPRMVAQQQEQQHNMHGYTPASGHWQQQQQQQHSSPFPSLSGTSCSGTPAVQHQQQHSLRSGAAAGSGVEHIPQELKFMAPLRRHQQYLGTT
jgi:hypothetical protein